jgi:NADH-quinone oxidoreductase subunit E
LAPGETSADGKWTLVTTSCLGICGVGPVIMVDDDIYGNVEPDRVADILARYA